jgi:hypothetical protein
VIEFDPRYIAARRVLLDALDALVDHRDSLVLVGAQAIYLQAGDAELDASVAPFTLDADVGLNPTTLGEVPRIEEAMIRAGFVLKTIGPAGVVEPGTWIGTAQIGDAAIQVPVDLLVPKALAPQPGKRSAGLTGHEKNAARWTPGLEACAVDHSPMSIRSLEPQIDAREAGIRVAGPSALLVAKAHKLAERLRDGDAGKQERVKPKDASDITRLMRNTLAPRDAGRRLAVLARDEVCGLVVQEGVDHLRRLFGQSRARGVTLAVQALEGALPEALLRELLPSYVAEMWSAYANDAGQIVVE